MITNKMISSLSKKLLIAFGIVAIVFNLFAPAALAQTPEQGQWYTPTYGQFNTKVTGDPQEEIFGERYTQAQVYWIMYSLINFLTGSDVGKCVTQSGLDAAQNQANADALVTCLTKAGVLIPPNQTGYIQSKSPVLALAQFTDVVRTTMPADGIQYLAQKVNNIVPTAYAQNTGFGFSTLTGSQHLWGAARDMTYGLMVLVILILAFGVMFRVKLNPQTSITIQSAIPKVVIALIAITFSFAIAGLLIDLAYLVQGIVASFVVASGISGLNPIQFLQTMNNPFYGIMSIGAITIIIVIVGIIVTIAGSVGGIVEAIGIGGFILGILLLLCFIISLVRILWLFLKTYAVLLINIVFGPFIILAGAVNLGGGLMGWIKSIVAQLSVFVASSILIVVAHIFIWGAGGTFIYLLSGCPNGVFNAYCIQAGQGSLGSANLPGFSGQDPSLLGFFVGLVVLFAVPNLASFVRDSISKPARLDLGLGSAFAPIAVPIGLAREGVSRGISGYIGGRVQTRLGSLFSRPETTETVTTTTPPPRR